MLTRLPALRRRRGMPAPGDMAAFLEVARRSFVRVQQAWDHADLDALSVVTTEPLLRELADQLALRGQAPNHTEVLQVEARLLGLDQLQQAQVASVEFSGLIREEQGARAQPFRELWMLARLPAEASGRLGPAEVGDGWRVARVQALS